MGSEFYAGFVFTFQFLQLPVLHRQLEDFCEIYTGVSENEG